MKASALSLLLPLALGPLGCAPALPERALAFDGVHGLQLRWSRGRVLLEEVEGRGSVVVHLRGADCEATSIGGVLRLSGGGEALLPGSELVVELPPGLPVEAELERGELRLVGLGGTLRASVGRGSLEAEELESEDALVQVARGELAASWSRAPRRLVATSGEGDLELVLPEASYELDLSGVPELRGLRDEPGAPRRVEARAPRGELRLLARGISAHEV